VHKHEGRRDFSKKSVFFAHLKTLYCSIAVVIKKLYVSNNIEHNLRTFTEISTFNFRKLPINLK